MCHLSNTGRAETRGLEDFDLWTSKYSADGGLQARPDIKKGDRVTEREREECY